MRGFRRIWEEGGGVTRRRSKGGGAGRRTEVGVGVGGGIVARHRLGEVAEMRVRGLRGARRQGHVGGGSGENGLELRAF